MSWDGNLFKAEGKHWDSACCISYTMATWQQMECHSQSPCGGLAGNWIWMHTKYMYHIQELSHVLIFAMHNKGMELITRIYCHPAELGLFLKKQYFYDCIPLCVYFCLQIYLFIYLLLKTLHKNLHFWRRWGFMVEEEEEEEGYGCHWGFPPATMSMTPSYYIRNLIETNLWEKSISST